MKKYNIKYIIKTTSRAGAYLYDGNIQVQAENKEEAKRIARTEIPKGSHFKRFTILIQSIKEEME